VSLRNIFATVIYISLLRWVSGDEDFWFQEVVLERKGLVRGGVESERFDVSSRVNACS
jgi:hypothetical protein